MRYIIIFLVLATSYIAYKAHYDVLSENVEFGMSELKIIKKNGEELKIKAKVADTVSERSQGLMEVKSMGEDEGMLFIFEEEQMRKMWMANTYIPLDMLFVSEKKEIFNIKENAIPLSKEIIYSVGPAMYVVELNGGFVKKHGLAEGDKIDFKIED